MVFFWLKIKNINNNNNHNHHHRNMDYLLQKSLLIKKVQKTILKHLNKNLQKHT